MAVVDAKTPTGSPEWDRDIQRALAASMIPTTAAELALFENMVPNNYLAAVRFAATTPTRPEELAIRAAISASLADLGGGAGAPDPPTTPESKDADGDCPICQGQPEIPPGKCKQDMVAKCPGCLAWLCRPCLATLLKSSCRDKCPVCSFEWDVEDMEAACSSSPAAFPVPAADTDDDGISYLDAHAIMQALEGGGSIFNNTRRRLDFIQVDDGGAGAGAGAGGGTIGSRGRPRARPRGRRGSGAGRGRYPRTGSRKRGREN